MSSKWVESHLRPIALGRANWLFAGSRQPARINGHDLCACFGDVLERLPMLPAGRIDQLLSHRWLPAS